MQFQDLPAQDQIRITYGDLEVTFGDAAHAFGVNGIKHLGFSSQFARYPTTGTSTEFWKVRFSDDAGASGSFQELTNFSSATRSYSFDPNAGLSLFFTGLDLPGEADAVDVTVYVKPLPESGMIGWKIDVSNSSSTYAIWNIVFPEIPFANIDGDGPHSTLVVPWSDGRTYINPINGGSISSGIQEPAGQWYPGGGYQMQYSAYYRKLGHPYYPDPTRSAGVYLAIYDGAPVAPKKFTYTVNAGAGKFTYACTNNPNDVSTIGVDYIMPYDHILGVFAGDWYDAAQIYRQWSTQQGWTSKGPVSSRTDMADWYKKVTAVHRTDGENTTPVESATKALELNGMITGPMMVKWYKWGSSRDNDYPPVLDAQPGFATAVSTMVDANIFPFPYVNGRMWSSYDPCWPVVKPYAKRDPDGTIHWASGGDSYCADMEYGTSFWRNYMANICADIVQTHGVKGIYLDEMGKVPEYGDYDPNHGIPLGINESSVAFEHQGMEEMVAAVHAIDPDVMFWGEGCAEFAMDVLHGKLISYTLYKGFTTPPFAAVYHDYWSYTGRNTSTEMEIGWLFTIGAQIGRLWPSITDDPVIIDYLAGITELRSIASKYLIFGKMMRPPLIDATELPELSQEVKGNMVYLPAIMASAWKSPYGQLGLAVTNMHDSPLDVNITMDLDE